MIQHKTHQMKHFTKTNFYYRFRETIMTLFILTFIRETKLLILCQKLGYLNTISKKKQPELGNCRWVMFYHDSTRFHRYLRPLSFFGEEIEKLYEQGIMVFLQNEAKSNKWMWYIHNILKFLFCKISKKLCQNKKTKLLSYLFDTNPGTTCESKAR